MKPLFLLPAVALIALVASSSLRVIQLHYPRAVESDPLRSPFTVQSVSGTTLVLEDGRTFDVDTDGESLEEIIGESGYRIDVESEVGGSNVGIYAKRRGWICGTPWAALVNIPLIADDVPINRRELIGFASANQDQPGVPVKPAPSGN